MLKSGVIPIILAIGIAFSANVGLGFTLNVECDKNGFIKTQSIDEDSTVKHSDANRVLRDLSLLATVASGAKKCEDDSDNLAIQSDTNSLGRQWSTINGNKKTIFSKSKVQKIIDDAVNYGSDPYLALGISINEDPPYQNSYGGRFEGKAGSTIADSTAAMLIGCTTNRSESKKQFAAKHNATLVNATRSAKAYSNELLCIGPEILDKSYLNFKPPSPGTTKGALCCANVRIDQVEGENPESTQLRAKDELLSYLFNKFLITNTLNPSSYNYVTKPTGMSKEEQIAWQLQSYNGFKIFNAGGRSPCLNGINTRTHPIIGATYGDLIFNSLVQNSVIDAMIVAAKIRHGKHQKSILCTTLGSGNHSLDSIQFAKLQLKYAEENPKTIDGKDRVAACKNGNPKLTFDYWNEKDRVFLGK